MTSVKVKGQASWKKFLLKVATDGRLSAASCTNRSIICIREVLAAAQCLTLLDKFLRQEKERASYSFLFYNLTTERVDLMEIL